MKYGHCKNHPAIYAQNSRGLCANCTREKHRQSAESKGLIIKQKDEHRGNKVNILTVDSVLQEPNEPIQAKQGLFKKKTAKIKHRSDKNKDLGRQELALFNEIWKERPHVCQVTGQVIHTLDIRCFSHILAKGAYPRFRLLKENIWIVTPEIHHKWEFESRDSQLFNQKKEKYIELKKKYYE